jgi:Flp pilus assembly protein TadG
MIRNSNPLRSGQALVEFALVVPILLLLVFGIIEFARAWQTYQTLTDAAREGARRSVVIPVPPTLTAAQSAAHHQSVIDSVRVSLSRATLDPNKATITTSVPAGELFPGHTNSPVTVRIEYQFDFIVIGRLIGWATGQDRITFTTSSVMRKE